MEIGLRKCRFAGFIVFFDILFNILQARLPDGATLASVIISSDRPVRLIFGLPSMLDVY